MACSCSTIAFGVLAAIGVIIMIAVGSIVVKEYNLAKGFEPTECRAHGVQELGIRPCSYCYTTHTYTRRSGRRTSTSKRKCRPSELPCVRAAVSYFDHYGNNRTATFYPDAVEMSQSYECSFYSCGATYYRSQVLVQNRARQFVQKHQGPFSCYYSKSHLNRVIGRKIYGYNDAFHGMLWPGLITGVALIGVCVTLFGLHEKCISRKAPDLNPDENDERNANPAAIGGDSSRGSTLLHGAAGGTPGQAEKLPLNAAATTITASTAPPPYPPPQESGYLRDASGLYPPPSLIQPPNPVPGYGGVVTPSQPPPAVGWNVDALPPGYQGEVGGALPSAPPPSYNSLLNQQ